jgi:hypothetical protein
MLLLQQLKRNRGTVFTTRTIHKYYKQLQLGELVGEMVREPLLFSCSELLLFEIGVWDGNSSGTQRKEVFLLLQPAAKQRLVKEKTANLCV